jgi:hypothetical protein
VEVRSCKLLFLPPYYARPQPYRGGVLKKMKGLLGQAGAYTREAPIEAIGRVLTAVTARDTRGFFEPCGYRSPVQSL